MEDEIEEYRTHDPDFKDNYMFSLDILDINKVIHYLNIDNLIPNHEFTNYYDLKIKNIPKFHENIDIINDYLKNNLGLKKQIIICLKNYQIKNFVKYLAVPYLLTDENNLSEYLLNIITKEFANGFTYEDKIILTASDLFNISLPKKKYKTKFKYATKIENINKLEIGDYVVHSINGIGIYNGIRTLKVNDLKKDYLEVLYKGDDKLYIPVEKIELISKYSGRDGLLPKINGLGSLEWKKNKQKYYNFQK